MKTTYRRYDNRDTYNNRRHSDSNGGIAFVLLGPLISQYSMSDTSSSFEDNLSSNLSSTDITNANNVFSLFTGFLHIIGSVLIALAIINFIVARGLLKGKGWAWTLSVIVTLISLVIGIIFVAINSVAGDISSIIGQIVGMVINGVILWYLYRPNVKAFFGKVKIQAP